MPWADFANGQGQTHHPGLHGLSCTDVQRLMSDFAGNASHSNPENTGFNVKGLINL